MRPAVVVGCILMDDHGGREVGALRMSGVIGQGIAVLLL